MAVIKRKLNLNNVNVSAGTIEEKNGLYYVIDEQTGQYFSKLIDNGCSWSIWIRYAFSDIQRAIDADLKLNKEFRSRMYKEYWGDLPPIE